MIRIRLFGGLSVSRDDQRLLAPSATQPRRLAILATIAHAGERGVSRERLHTLFWPDANEDVARRGLTQALYALRTGLDAEQLFLGVQELRLNREIATCDVGEYVDAIDGGELERAAALYQGPFLDGFRVPGAADFERRVEDQRAELVTRHQALLERLAARATKNGEADRAVDWWRQRAAMDLFNARVAEAYMRALVAAGDRVGAIRHARVHVQLVEQEFGTAASVVVTQLAEQLQAVPETPPPTTMAAVPVARATPTAAPFAAAEPVAEPVAAPVAALVAAPLAAPVAAASQQTAPEPAAVQAAFVDRRARRSRSTRSIALLASAAVIIVAALFVWNARRTPDAGMDDADLQSLRVSGPRRIAADAMFELDPAISPDGRNIAFAAGDEGALRLYVQQREGGRAVPVAESVAGDQRRPHWSPDGASIVFQATRGIWIVPALGGTARLVVEKSAGLELSASSPIWSPNGQELAWVSRDSIYRMPIGGGVRRFVAKVTDAHSLAWSPDGQWIAAVSGNPEFDVGTQGNFGRTGFGIGNLAPSAIVLIPIVDAHRTRDTIVNTRVLIPPLALNASPAWLDQRTLIFVSRRGGTRDLFAVHITNEGTMRGDLERITAGLDAHSVSASADGQQLAYAVFRQSSNVWSLPLRPDAPATVAAATRVTHGTQVVEGLDVSVDGRWLAYDADVVGQQDIFRLPLLNGAPASSDAERIVSSAVDDFHPAWSPDAQWIAFYTFRGSVRRAAYVPASGGVVRLVQPTGPNVVEHSPVWSADGKSLIFFRGEYPLANLYRADRVNDTTWSPSRRLTTSGGLAASFSADGRQIVYSSAPGILRLTDSTFRESTSHVILSPPSKRAGPVMTSARIAPDGRAVVVKGYDDIGSGIWWYPLTDGALGAPRVLIRFDDPRRSSPRPEFATDGRFLYFTLAEREADVWVLQLERH